MEFITGFVSFVLHIDHHLGGILQQYGAWSYALFFAIIFCETGLVITPFLPGDSLLFALGAFAGAGDLNIMILAGSLMAAAILGNTVNYCVGKYCGQWLLHLGGKGLIKQAHLDKTHAFYEKYGAKTLVITRFVPIVRTIAPFVAGLGTMKKRTFFFYNIAGGLLWVGLFVFGGYFLGTTAFAKKYFSEIVMAIIVISVLPVVIEVWRHRKKK
jgi:membrane-associated protein